MTSFTTTGTTQLGMPWSYPPAQPARPVPLTAAQWRELGMTRESYYFLTAGLGLLQIRPSKHRRFKVMSGNNFLGSFETEEQAQAVTVTLRMLMR